MFNKKVVYITGAASGIGYELAMTFAQQGAHLVLVDLDQKGVENAASQLTNEGHEALGLRCNVTKEEEIVYTIQKTMDHFGRLDVLINNAGLQHVAAIEDFPTEKFELLTRVMLVAPFLTTKYVLPIMKKQKFGRILNMSSINGLVGFAGKAAYNSAKHGVIGLTKVTALEAAEYNVTANALCPGYIATPLVHNQLNDLAKIRNVTKEQVMEEVIYPLVPQKRLLTVKEVANYAIFLASEQAKGVTGQAVAVDGGYTAQ